MIWICFLGLQPAGLEGGPDVRGQEPQLRGLHQEPGSLPHLHQDGREQRVPTEGLLLREADQGGRGLLRLLHQGGDQASRRMKEQNQP